MEHHTLFEQLKRGNECFARGTVRTAFANERIRSTALLCCSGLGASPEALFGPSAATIATIQTPAHVFDESARLSLDWIAHRGDLRLVLVLGHTPCRVLRDGEVLPAALREQLTPGIDPGLLRYARAGDRCRCTPSSSRARSATISARAFPCPSHTCDLQMRGFSSNQHRFDQDLRSSSESGCAGAR